MSLFDVIKYSSIDLESESELADLPIELFEVYRIAAFTHYGRQTSLGNTTHRGTRITGMADWTESNIIKQAIFNKVLKEWNNEFI